MRILVRSTAHFVGPSSTQPESLQNKAGFLLSYVHRFLVLPLQRELWALSILILLTQETTVETNILMDTYLLSPSIGLSIHYKDVVHSAAVIYSNS
jgi:hypothetical protein